MKLSRFIISLFALLLLLPIHVSAEYINVYPGPDSEWNYLYDYGDVEVGQSGVMIFQIENDIIARDDLFINNLYIEEAGPFAIVDVPYFPVVVPPGDSIYLEVTFTPDAELFYEGVMRINSNASNIPPGGDIRYGLQGFGVGEEPPPGYLMASLIDFYDDGLDYGFLYGLGSGKAAYAHERVFGNMLDAADDLIAAGDFEGACEQLDHAASKVDGKKGPPDFIGGMGVDELHSMILYVMNALGC